MDPGVSVHYGLERGRFLVPAALVAWVIALELTLPWLLADLSALAASASPGDRGPAVLVGGVLRAWCCAAASTRWCRLVLAPYRLCLAAATIAAVVAGAVARLPGQRARRSNLAWGVGAVVAVLAAGILTSEAAHAPAAAKEP